MNLRAVGINLADLILSFPSFLLIGFLKIDLCSVASRIDSKSNVFYGLF